MNIQSSQSVDYGPHVYAVDARHTSYSTGSEYHQDAYVAVYLDAGRVLRLSLSPDEARDLAQRLLGIADSAEQMNAAHGCGAATNGGLVPAATAV